MILRSLLIVPPHSDLDLFRACPMQVSTFNLTGKRSTHKLFHRFYRRGVMRQKHCTSIDFCHGVIVVCSDCTLDNKQSVEVQNSKSLTRPLWKCLCKGMRWDHDMKDNTFRIRGPIHPGNREARAD